MANIYNGYKENLNKPCKTDIHDVTVFTMQSTSEHKCMYFSGYKRVILDPSPEIIAWGEKVNALILPENPVVSIS